MGKGTSKRAEVSYRWVANPTRDEDGEGRSVLAATQADGVIGLLNLRPDQPRARGVRGLATSLAFVHPSYRRQGIATAMNGIAHHMLGYEPEQDDLRTDAGEGFVKSMPSARFSNESGKRMKMPSWDISADEASESIPDIQTGNWQKGEPIEPSIAHVLTPAHKGASTRGKRPRPLPEQMKLF